MPDSPTSSALEVKMSPGRRPRRRVIPRHPGVINRSRAAWLRALDNLRRAAWQDSARGRRVSVRLSSVWSHSSLGDRRADRWLSMRAFAAVRFPPTRPRRPWYRPS